MDQIFGKCKRIDRSSLIDFLAPFHPKPLPLPPVSRWREILKLLEGQQKLCLTLWKDCEILKNQDLKKEERK